MTVAGDLARRARFISVEEGFNIARPALEPCGFDAELRRALDPAGSTGRIDLDCSARLGTPWPATSPLMLAGKLRIRLGERLARTKAATAEIFCVVEGRQPHLHAVADPVAERRAAGRGSAMPSFPVTGRQCC